jgi:hypothetical protein
MVDLLVLTSSDRLLFLLKLYYYFFYKTTYLIKEVNCTKPSPSVSIAWLLSGSYICQCKFGHSFALAALVCAITVRSKYLTQRS